MNALARFGSISMMLASQRALPALGFSATQSTEQVTHDAHCKL